MRLAVVQTNPVFGDVPRNVDHAIGLMQTTPADCYVLPELFNTGYNFVSREEVLSLSEHAEDGATARAVSDFARSRGCYVAYGFAENDGGRLFNSAVLVGPNGHMGLYRKVHLFDREHLFFEEGDVGFPVFDLPFGNVGMMICFDWIYPESARTLALKGAQLILHPGNLVLPFCPDAMITRCLENRVFAATANRVGRENRGDYDLTFIGKSEIVSPNGTILRRLSDDREEVTVVEVDISEALNKRVNQYNDLLLGRRPDKYVP